ncbi:MAG: arsenate reductase/protein-tyrosine-phosphatase family protein [Sporichthyaceae bacterium]
MTPPRVEVLFVCTGNICRSPFAELVTAHLLREALGTGADAFGLHSAGTAGLDGWAMNAESRAELAPWGLHTATAESFRARPLSPAMLAQADLVLGLAPEHRASALRTYPQAMGKVFTLREFARLVEAIEPVDLPGDPAERTHALIALARSRRGSVRAEHPGDDGVIDPYGRSPRTHREVAMQIAGASAVIARAIAG